MVAVVYALSLLTDPLSVIICFKICVCLSRSVSHFEKKLRERFLVGLYTGLHGVCDGSMLLCPRVRYV